MITKVKNVLILILCSLCIGLLLSCTMNEASNDDIKKESPKKEKSSITLTVKVIYESNYTADYKLSGLPAGCNIYDAIAAFDEEFDEYLKSQQTGNIEEDKIDEGIRRVANIAPYETYTIKKENGKIIDFTKDIFEDDTDLKIFVTKSSNKKIDWGCNLFSSNLQECSEIYSQIYLEGAEDLYYIPDVFPAYVFVDSKGKIILRKGFYSGNKVGNNKEIQLNVLDLPLDTYKVFFLANGYLCSNNGKKELIEVPDISFFTSDSISSDYYYTIKIYDINTRV